MRFTNLFAVATACVSAAASAQTERELESHDHGSATLNIAVEGTSVFIELDTPWNNLVGFEYQPKTDEQKAMVDEALALLNQPEQLFVFNKGDCKPADVDIDSSLATGHDDEHDDHHDDDHGDKHDDDHDDDHADKHDDDHDDDHADKHDDDHDDGHAEKHDDDHDDGHAEKHDDDHDDDHAEKHDDDHDDDHADKHDDGHGDGHDDHDDHGDSEGTHSAALISYSFSCSETARLTSIDVRLFDNWSGFEDIDVQLIGPGGQALVELSSQQTQIDISQIQ